MWNPPIVLTAEEQKIATRTRKTRKFFGARSQGSYPWQTQVTY
jgi:hypothetical protein